MIRSILLTTVTAFFLVFISACTPGEADTLGKIRKQGEIKFAVSAGYIPFSFYSGNQDLTGFDIDMAKAISQHLRVKAVILDIPWSKIIESLQNGSCDAIVSSMAVTQERSALISFSEPYYYSRSHLFVRKDSAMKKISEIKGKVIGCTRGTTYEQDARKLEAGQIKLYGNDEEALQQLVGKRIDAVMTDEILGMYAIRHRLMPIEPLGSYIRTEQIAIAVRKEDESLRKEINSIIKSMRDQGTIRQLIEKTGEGKYR